MSETTRHMPLGRLPWGLLGMASLMLGVEWTIARHELDLTTPFALDWKQSRRAAETEAPRCAILCFGDSLMKFGVAPRVIEGRLGLPAYNLSLAGGPMPTSYFQLRRALRAGARPKAVLIDGELLDTSVNSRIHDRTWPELLDIGECLDISITARNATVFGTIMLGRLLPSIRSRFEIQVSLREALTGTHDSPRRLWNVYYRNWSANKGAQIRERKLNYSLDHVVRAYFPYTWKCDPLNAIYTRRFLELAEAHGLTVFWLLPPVSPISQQRRDECGGHARYVEFVQALQTRFPRLIVIDGRHSGYDQAVHCDESHLDLHGAAVFSAEVAAVLGRFLQDGLSGSGWVELPRFRSSMANTDLLEDFTQSRAALREAYSRRLR